MVLNSYNRLIRAHLSFKLTVISIRELLFINEAPCNIYGVENKLFHRLIKRGTVINKDVLRKILQKGEIHLFVYNEDREKLILFVQDKLVQLTRSLSVGNPLTKGIKQMNLLTINMSYLYLDPTNDELLNLQHQCAKNLAYFLINKPDIHEPLYKSYLKQKHHYIFAQPIISSLFVLGVLKFSQTITDKEIENLFITSYFKDIGMSAIPTQKYELADLNESDKQLLSNHPEQSVHILKNRLQLAPNHLAIIKNHHSFSLLGQDLSLDSINLTKTKTISGFETLIVITMDIISAMINERPYQKVSTLFEALELIKLLIADKYPREFNLIVNYFRSFFFDRKIIRR